MADRFDVKSYYNDISRLFSGGPVVRQRVANKIAAPGSTGVPVGTAKAFLKHVNTAYASTVASYGQYNRLARYSDYQEMESMAELASGLDIYADEACTPGEYGEIVKVTSPNVEIREHLTELFEDVLNIQFNAWHYIRALCKFGDFFLMVDHHPDYGVLNLMPMPINEIEREEGYDPDNPMKYRYRWITQGNRTLENWQVIHFRLLGNDNFLPYGASILEPARRVWRQLILMEDAVMVYRIVRSPERRVFYIDVGNVSPKDIPAFMEKVKTQLKRNQVVDADTGRVDVRYNAMSTDEDYWIPSRGEHSSRIETLPGGQFTGDIDDLVYIQNKLFAALKIPKSYLGYEQDLSGKATLSQEDVRFARTIQRVQNVFIQELNKVALIHLYSMGYKGEDLVNFEIAMANPSAISEIQRLELWRTKFEVASIAGEGTFDRNFVYKKLFKLTGKDIEAIEEGKKKDRMFDLELETMQPPAPEVPPEGELPPEEAPPPEGAEAMPPPAGEVPAAPPPEAGLPPPPGPPAIMAGRDPHRQVVGPNDVVNPLKTRKSDGPLADLATPDLVQHVFGMDDTGMDIEKDMKDSIGKARNPFGEAGDPEEKIFSTRIGRLKQIEDSLSSVYSLRDAHDKKAKKILVESQLSGSNG